MSLVQKFRTFMTERPAATATLAGLLTLWSMLPFSKADAQEPNKASHPPSGPNITEQHRSTLTNDAMDYSETHKGIGIMIAVGKDDEGVSGSQLGNAIKKYFKSQGIESKVYTGPSSGQYTAILYTVKGIPVSESAVGLNEAKALAEVAIYKYEQAYGIVPPTKRNPNVAAAAPVLNQQ